MARAPSKHGGDQPLDFRGFLSDLQDRKLSRKDKDKKMRPQQPNKDIPKSGDFGTSFGSEDSLPDAASEKDLGNEYFKQKKFKEAIDCYSRSIALSPTAVAFANRAMSYIKIKRFQEAENDCTEALNLDDRYIKAYSRRATARKELGKLKASIEDAEFALRLEPHNQEIKKQYAEAKSLYEKRILQKISEQEKQNVGKLDTKVNGHIIQPVSSSTQRKQMTAVEDHTKKINKSGKQAWKVSVQELASRAASRANVLAAQNITRPTTAYQFEASWRGLSGDRALQAKLLKAIYPRELPYIFKNALTVHILVDIIKCVTTFFIDEMALTVSFLENLTKVPRFDTLIMFLSSKDKDDLAKTWDEVFYYEVIPIEFAEKLDNLRTKYCLK
ncbi:RNA polymerase II-associated protein 3 isoform X1 [Rosa chinensis]|uniref:RNA polymerase II-associated protein 3 isoform X1 n=2 Tax=Rosa chinensis TaxID=74649 RepID=UPI000D089218|nr:RNA polymerase II-associated protein 3 isoform X1 [Rosa chinensis]